MPPDLDCLRSSQRNSLWQTRCMPVDGCRLESHTGDISTDDVVSRVFIEPCIGTGGHHPSWHGRRTGRPQHQAGQDNGGMLPECPVAWRKRVEKRLLCRQSEELGKFFSALTSFLLVLAHAAREAIESVFQEENITACGPNYVASKEEQSSSRKPQTAFRNKTNSDVLDLSTDRFRTIIQERAPPFPEGMEADDMPPGENYEATFVKRKEPQVSQHYKSFSKYNYPENGQQTEIVVLTTQNVVDVESLIKFILLLKKRGTLPGTDFLGSAVD
ncbi:hypothetical protein TNCV_5061671 [Trichonephila clavipes]|nr:hypothetical protein TNCV_5061671 [Trichonephila clavipes]